MNSENEKQDEKLDDDFENDDLGQENENPLSDLATYNFMKAFEESKRQERLKKTNFPNH